MASKRKVNVKASGRAKAAKSVAKAKKTIKKSAKPAAKKAPAKKPVARRPAAKAASKTVKSVKKPVAKPKAAAKPSKPTVAAKPVAKIAAKPIAKPVAPMKPAVVAHKPAPVAVPQRPMAAAKPAAPTLVAVSNQVKPPIKPGVRPNLQLVASKPIGRPNAPTELLFKPEDFVVYPTHGVGRVTGIETQEISGMRLTLFVVHFEKDKMTLRVPVAKANTVGMRRLSSPDKMRTALKTLKGRARVKRTMWSRRAQEYEAKINSGDPISIAEVVRDLHRNAGQPEQSYSERQIYEAALDRLARELAAVERIDEEQATARLEKVLRAA